METDELREALGRAGLSEYQADAYVTLVELGTVPAVELAQACSVPQARIYDVLRDLEEKGYVETYERGSLHARAQEPEAATETLRRQAQTATSAAEELRERWERPEIGEHRVSVVNQFDTVRKRAVEYVERADYQVQLAATPAQFRDLEGALADARDRGVVVKLSLHPEQPEAFDPDDDLVAAFEAAATEVRYRDMPVPFVQLADRDDVCFAPPAGVHPVNEYGMVVDDYALGQVFEWYFETALWESGEAVFDGRPAEPPVTYASIRDCIRDVEPHVEAGRAVRLRVEGRYRESNEEVTLEGTVADLVHAGSDGAGSPLRRYASRATVSLDVGDQVVEVGGWGALLEDVEAHRLVVTGLDDG